MIDYPDDIMSSEEEKIINREMHLACRIGDVK